MAKTNKQIIDEYQKKINKCTPKWLRLSKTTVREILIGKGIIKARPRRKPHIDQTPAIVGEEYTPRPKMPENAETTFRFIKETWPIRPNQHQPKPT